MLKKSLPFVVIFALAGTIFFVASHAASPYASLTADKGVLAGGATSSACSGASDGNCVVFGSAGNGNMIVGIDGGGWGPNGSNDVSGAVNYVRLDQARSTITGDIGYFTANKVKVDVDFSGDVTNSGKYDSGGVSTINPNTWANDALSWYKANCNTAECPMIEVLNEPYGDWFWGSNADNKQNADAYALLTEDTYNAFRTQYGSSAPKILSNIFANGCNNGSTLGCSDSWWSSWISKDYPDIGHYVDGVVIHPYGGTSNPPLAAQGNRAAITSAYNATGKPVYVTEVGWPTDNSGVSATSTNATGDSMQWPQADSSGNAYHGDDQCDNIYNFISWGRSTGYINAIILYNYADYGSNSFYGIVNSSASAHKPSYTALKDASQNLPNPCPDASNGYTLQNL